MYNTSHGARQLVKILFLRITLEFNFFWFWYFNFVCQYPTFFGLLIFPFSPTPSHIMNNVLHIILGFSFTHMFFKVKTESSCFVICFFFLANSCDEYFLTLTNSSTTSFLWLHTCLFRPQLLGAKMFLDFYQYVPYLNHKS